MKKGFTMIELIFVIVILGILAAVAIPRLAATRDDAKASSTAANVATLYSDLGAYYTAQGKWSGEADSATGSATAVTATELKKMTNVDANISSGTISFYIDSAKCFDLALDKNGTIGSATNKATSGACFDVVSLPGVKSLIDVNQTFGGRKINR